MKIYVGCSLRHAPESFRREVEAIKNELRKKYEVYDFVGLTNGTPTDVYNWDIHECVAKCDAFIAICDHPSIGLGYEIGVAVEHFKKPTLALAHNNSDVTRFLQGIQSDTYTFNRYADRTNLLAQVETFVEHI